LKKLLVLTAMLALGLATAVPALAQVSLEVGDNENESGGISIENSFSVEGNNSSACLGQQQFGQTGNLGNQQGSEQYEAGADDSEFIASETEFGPGSEQECEQKVQQSSAASSGKEEKKEEKKVEVKKEEKKEEKKVEVKPAEKKEEKKEEVVVKAEAGEKKEEKKEEKKKELPKSGGTGSASLLALGAGALLVGGGLLARRFVR
jgi:LPXTG-motif cell wall-anchored protein